jgi:hypothetical protein
VVTLERPSDEALTTLDAVDIPDSVSDIDRPPRRREVTDPEPTEDRVQR